MAAARADQQRIDARHAAGRLTAYERLDILFDQGSIVELGTPGGGVITASGTIDGRRAFAFSQDRLSAGAIMIPEQAAKIVALIDRAIAAGDPVIGLHDSPGSALEDGLAGLAAHASVMHRQALAHGVVPQIAMVFDRSAGTAALSPALADIVFMLGGSALFVAGPEVLRMATGELTTAERLGGAALHTTDSGVADDMFDDEIAMLFATRDLLGLLPSTSDAESSVVAIDPRERATPALDTLVPLDPDTPYDMRELVRAIVDECAPFELQPQHAGNMLCAFGRIDGRPVGIVACQPLVLGGTIDGAAACKAARFVRLCDRLGLPIVTMVDSPGLLPGAAQEANGILRHAAALLAAFAQADVPRVTVVTRRAIGAAWAVLAPKTLGTARCYAWPGAEIAAMPTAAADRLFGDDEREKRRDYAAHIADPDHAVASGLVDAVIRPAETRATIARALRELANDRTVHRSTNGPAQ